MSCVLSHSRRRLLRSPWCARPNFADPDYEPSDEDLVRLSSEAFAGLGAEAETRTRKLRADIRAARERALAAFHARPAATSAP